MLEKLPNKAKEIIGAGVLAVAGVASDNVNAGVRERLDNMPTVEHQINVNVYENAVGLKSSLNEKFKEELIGKGFESLSILPPEEDDDNSTIYIVFMGRTDSGLGEKLKLAVTIDKETASNKYKLQERLVNAISEELKD